MCVCVLVCLFVRLFVWLFVTLLVCVLLCVCLFGCHWCPCVRACVHDIVGFGQQDEPRGRKLLAMVAYGFGAKMPGMHRSGAFRSADARGDIVGDTLGSDIWWMEATLLDCCVRVHVCV